MAGRVQALCQAVVDDYDGDAAAIWLTASSGPELLKRMKALPGFGEQKAKIFVALLGKQFGVQPPGWQASAGAYGVDGSLLSVADIRDPASLAQVRAYKKQAKAAAGRPDRRRLTGHPAAERRTGPGGGGRCRSVIATP